MILGRRRNRVVGAIWGLVSLGFAAAAVLLWLDARRVGFEVPAAAAAAVVAWMFARQRVEIDRHGVCTRLHVGEDRLLWAGVDRVEVRRTSWIRPGLVVHPKGDGDAIAISASAAMRRRQRDRLLEFLTDLSRQHGFVLVTVHGDVISETRPEPLADATARVRAVADGETMFDRAGTWSGGVADEEAVADDVPHEDAGEGEVADGDAPAVVPGDDADDVPRGPGAAVAGAEGDPVAGEDTAEVAQAGDAEVVAAEVESVDDDQAEPVGAAPDRTDDPVELHPLTPPWLLPSPSSGPIVSDLD